MSLVTLAPNPSFTSALKYIILQHTGATPFTPSLLLAPKSSQYGHSTALHHLCHNLLDQPQTQDSGSLSLNTDSPTTELDMTDVRRPGCDSCVMRNIDLFGNYDIPRRTATQASSHEEA